MTTRPMNRVVQHLRQIAGHPRGAERTDAQLLESFVREREAAALEILIQRHAGMVWGVCRRLLAHHHDAEDAFQATFLVLVRKAAGIVPRSMVGNWLYGVARQTALKARSTANRRRAREKQVTPMPEPEIMAHEDRWPQLQTVLDEELSRLPDIYRSAILLCDLQGKTGRDAARQLGVPDGTLAARLRRGRALLAKRLARRGFAASGALLAAALAQQAASASVPAAVLTCTVKAATFAAAGHATSAGLVSAGVVALTEGVIKTMLLTRLRISLLLVVALAIAGIGVTHRLLPTLEAGTAATANPRPDQQAAGAGGKATWPADAFDAFDMLTPAGRLQWLQKHKRDMETTAVARGDVIATLVVRGSLESAKPGNVICSVRPFPLAADYAVIKWVIDEGKKVKKGDVVLELDDMALKQALAKYAVDLRSAEIATLRAKRDGDQKVARAQQAIVERLKPRVSELEQQAQACRIVAPHDGIVMYFVPEQRRDAKQQAIVAQGEPVREGQILLQVPDLSQMQVRVLLPKTQIGQLRQPDPKKKRPPQPAQIRVNAFPNRVLQGHVAMVDTLAQANEFMLRGELRYKALTAVDHNDGKLLPGMSADVTIETGRANKALYVPATAVLPRGMKHYCYVRSPAGVEKAEVVPGVRSDNAIEIRSGLREGDQVLTEPALQLRGMPAGSNESTLPGEPAKPTIG